MNLTLCIWVQFLCLLQYSSGTEDTFTVERQMGKTSYQIVSATRSTETVTDTQKCVAVVRAPINTEVDTFKRVTWMGTVDWQQVSADDDGTSALYKTTITASRNKYMILPVLLKSGKESLRLNFNTFVERENQTDFNFNNCQFQVERKDSTESTLFKITIRSCICRRRFQASVGKITPSGFEETAELSALYFFPAHMHVGSMRDDQISSIFINRTSLKKDGVQIKSLDFLIKRESDDFQTDLIDRSTYGYSLI